VSVSATDIWRTICQFSPATGYRFSFDICSRGGRRPIGAAGSGHNAPVVVIGQDREGRLSRYNFHIIDVDRTGKALPKEFLQFLRVIATVRQ